MKLFEPLRIAGMEVANRIVMPPMVTDLANTDGTASPELIAYYRRRAEGGVGMVEVEATTVDYRHRLSRRQLAIDDDRLLPGLRALAQAIKGAGARAAIQLHHPGRQEPASLATEPPVAPSAIPLGLPDYSVPPRELTGADIEELVARHARAALRAKKAGFDAVELHGAHGYLLCQFLSPLSNHRTDRYGGSPQGRARFVLEVLEAVRGQVGRDFPIFLRLSAQEFVDGGITLEDTRAYAGMAQEAGVDLISISAGNRLSSQWSTQPVFMPQGVLVPLAADIKRGLRIPVLVAGRINDPALAESILQQGKADLIAMGRALLADPDLPRKAREGSQDQVVRCIACMTCSQERPRTGICCLLNPETGKETRVLTPAPAARRVVVVGGGPAGLEAARVARLQGHRVTLWEEDKFGGRWSWLIRAYLSQQLHALKAMGVRVVEGKALTRQALARFQPHTVIVSPARKPLIPQLPGVPGEGVLLADEVLEGSSEVGRRVAVLGGGNAGCEVAHFLSARGVAVTLIESGPRLGGGLEVRTATVMPEELAKRGVQVRLQCQPRSFQDHRLILATPRGQEDLPVDTVVIALGYEPDPGRLALVKGGKWRVLTIPDCTSPAQAYQAAQTGAAAAGQL